MSWGHCTRSTQTSLETVEETLKHGASDGLGATILAQEEWETVSPKPPLTLPSCVTLSKSPYLSEPQCPHLQNGDTNRSTSHDCYETK